MKFQDPMNPGATPVGPLPGGRVRVAILADSPLPALRDGAQGRGAGQGATWLPPLARAFEAHDDLEITWVAFGEPSSARVDARVAGQRFLILPHLKATHDTLLGYRAARWRLRRALRFLRPDVVHAWGSERSYPSVLPGLQVPSVISIQGNMSCYAEIGGLPDNWFWRRQPRYEAGWVRRASVVACESPWSREIALGYWPGIDARVIEWGVHPSFYEVKRKEDTAVPYLLYCGGLERRKGIDVLFEALGRLKSRQWSLRLAGEGPLRERYEAAGLPQVEWLGNLKWDEMQRQMAGARGLVMPTRADTGPSVVKEALVAGVPVIGSANGGLRDYIVPGENGWLVDPLDAAGLASAMERLMSGEGFSNEVCRQRTGTDRAYFRPERAAAAFRQLYLELAARPGGPRS
jgi:glycosyltransferase involved in cell wall biosynthesis